VLSAILLAVSQVAIVYSQEARGYSLLLLLFIIASGAFITSFRSGSLLGFAAFVAAAAMMLYTHYYAVVALGGLLTYAVVARQRSKIPVLWWIAALAFVTLAYLPWLSSGVVASARENPDVGVDEALYARLASPLFALNWFNNGKLSGIREPAPWWAFGVGCILFTVPALMALRVVFGRRRYTKDRDSIMFVAISSALPVLCISSLGFFHIIYDIRHVSFAVAPYYLLVARGVSSVVSDGVRRVLCATILGYSALSLRADYFIPYKTDYREPLNVLARESRAGDCSIFGISDAVGSPVLYWNAYHHGRRAPTPIAPAQLSSASLCKRIWLVWDTGAFHSNARAYETTRETLALSHGRVSEWSFPAMELQLYVPR
jgi:hypothetical protein